MSRELFAFLLSELQTIRVLCRGQRNGKPCSGVVELDLADLEHFYQRLNACPLCGSSFGVFPASSGGVAQDGFTPLQRALADLNAVAKRFEVELVLPKKP